MIIVTGATGNIGRELVRLLATTSTAARLLVRDPSKAKNLGLPTVQGDLSDPASLDKAFEGANHLFLLAASSTQHAQHERNAIEAAKRARFQHVVKVSVIGASPTSPIQLARWHAEGEKLLKDSGIGWTMLQPHSFSQNLLGNAATIRSDGAIYGAAGAGKIPFVDVRDIAMVAFATLTQPGYMGRALVLTGGQAYSYEQAAQFISEAIGKPVRYVDLVAEVYEQNLVKAGLPAWLAHDLGALQTYFRSGAASEVVPTVQEVLRKPARTVEDFARDYVSAFRS